MNESIKKVLPMIFVIIVVLAIMMMIAHVSIINQNENLNKAKDIAQNQITTNTTYSEKIKIISTSCDFIYGKISSTYSTCNEYLLEELK